METGAVPPTDEVEPRLPERSWKRLIRHIKEQRCTPIIGAGASADAVKPAGPLATDWSEEFEYPLTDRTNLARVAQYLAITEYPMFPKERVLETVGEAAAPPFKSHGEPHGALARLQLPVYVTTNYDTFMFDALAAHDRDPQWDVCRWNSHTALNDHPSPLRRGRYTPTPAQPLVYHLHGRTTIPESMVLTEDDYLDFLVRLSTDAGLLPPPLPKLLTSTELLFVGYSLSDWTFRVLIRSLARSIGANMGYPAVAIQLNPKDAVEGRLEEAKEYIARYLGAIQLVTTLDVYWGKATDFARELDERLG
jgi:hypothetical protein